MTPVINEVITAIGQISDFTPTFDGTCCLNQRHQQAGQCAACATVCPTSAINLTPIPSIAANACLSCGACSAACPVGALNGVRTLAEIWHESRGAIDAHGTLTLACRAVADCAAVRIPCACSLPPEYYVALAMIGMRRVITHTTECDSCALGSGLAQADEAIRDAQRLLTPLGREFEAVRTIKTPPPQLPQKSVGITRRGLFSALLHPQMLHPQEKPDLVDDLIAQGVSARRALLINALQHINAEHSAHIPTYVGHWGSILARESCIGCQMCVQFCPTQALASDVDSQGRVTLWFDAARCTACGLCVRACFKHALELSDSVSLTDLAYSEYKPIWNGRPFRIPLKSPQVFKQPRQQRDDLTPNAR